MRQENGAPDPDNIDLLQQLIVEASSVVAFTGAGISTSAGISDYRSPGGIWTKIEPITYDEFRNSEQARLEDWRRRFAMNDQLAACQPTLAHRSLAAMARSGKLTTIVTQNIDGLHQRAGTPQDRLIELHGNATYGRCLDCRQAMDLDIVRNQIEEDQQCPACPQCGGLIKAAVISFGQAMPEEALSRASEFVLNADLILAIGSSLVVYPAATLPQIGVENGAKLAIINKQSTPLDHFATLVLNHSIDAVFAGLSG